MATELLRVLQGGEGGQFQLWRFPASYLYEGEGPDDTLKRIGRDMLGAKRWAVTGSKTYGFYDPSDWYPWKMHYDLGFVYDVKLAKVLTRRLLRHRDRGGSALARGTDRARRVLHHGQGGEENSGGESVTSGDACCCGTACCEGCGGSKGGEG